MAGKETPRKNELLALCWELKQDRKTYAEIATAINAAGFVNSRGGEFTEKSISRLFERNPQPVSATSNSRPDTSPTEETATMDTIVDTSTPSAGTTTDTSAATSAQEAVKDDQAGIEPTTSDAIPDTSDTEARATTNNRSMVELDQEITGVDNSISTADIEPKDTARVQAATSNTRPDTGTPTLPADLADLLISLHESGEFQQMIEWWRQQGGAMQSVPDRRPVFLGERLNCGLLLNADLKNAAMSRAKKDSVRTGGSLSLLVEWLLWRYLDSPAEFVTAEE